MIHLAGTQTALRQKRTMRRFGDSIDVAGLVAFLCSDESGHFTRQDIHVICEIDLSR